MDFRDRIVEFRRVPASELVENPKNWRRHGDDQRRGLRSLVEKIGFAGAELTRVLDDGRLMLIDGHLRKDEFKNQSLPVLVTDLNEHEADLLLATFDPLGAMATTDDEALESLLSEVNASFDDLGDLIADVHGNYDEPEAEPPGDPGAAIDRAEELQKQYGVERGQVWLLGRHRVMCGSSYDSEHITRLLDGKKPDMLHTDPPYGINIVKPRNGLGSADSGGAKVFGSTGETHRKGVSAVAERNSGKVGGGRGDEASLHARPNVGRGDPANIIQSNLYPVIEGDDTPFEPAQFLDFALVVIMWGANYYADKLPPQACWIVWDKRENITRNNFADCELAWTNQGSPARIFYHLWNGLHKGSQNGERRTHPTEKPVALFEEIGKLYADKGLWVDLFAGTGAQIVAAERSGATCYAMEYEPMYVATILDRLAKMGVTPQLASGKSPSET